MNILQKIASFFTSTPVAALVTEERSDFENVLYVDRNDVEAMQSGELMQIAHSRFGEHDAKVHIKCFGEFGYALAIESDHFGIEYFSIWSPNQTFNTVGYVRSECTTKDIDTILSRIGLALQYAKKYCVRLKEAGERVKEQDRMAKML